MDFPSRSILREQAINPPIEGADFRFGDPSHIWIVLAALLLATAFIVFAIRAHRSRRPRSP